MGGKGRFLKRGVYPEKEGWILGGSYRCLKEGYNCGRVDHGSAVHSCEQRGGLDSRSVALYKGWEVGSGRFWEDRI